MRGAQSAVNPLLEGKFIAVKDLHRFSTRAMSVDDGPLPCYVVRKKGRIRFYLRCLRNGRVHKKLVLYCKRKRNGNFRIYKSGVSNPIGYIKRGQHAYRVYVGRKYCAKIKVHHGGYEKVTTMVIGHRGVEFTSRVPYKTSMKKFRVDCVHPCSLLQAFAFAVLCWWLIVFF